MHFFHLLLFLPQTLFILSLSLWFRLSVEGITGISLRSWPKPASFSSLYDFLECRLWLFCSVWGEKREMMMMKGSWFLFPLTPRLLLFFFWCNTRIHSLFMASFHLNRSVACLASFFLFLSFFLRILPDFLRKRELFAVLRMYFFA